MPSNRVVIFAGGELSADFLRHIDEEDFIIGADSGALFLVEHGITPDIAVGDFDSVTQEALERIRAGSRETVTCDPVDKDLTDSELALDLALNTRPEYILLMGVTGTRMDHTLASIQMMTRALQRQVSCSVMDSNNYITLTGSQSLVHERGFTYVSLLPMTPEVTGITLQGFQYPLENATLKLGQSLAVSNRLLEETGTVTIESGLLLIIQSKD
ncbi:thiamine pyrophosphokinase [Paenibacillus sp. FSL R7-0273]|uniref:thiamine diphosphokinase n=1 Tax=Paenibacillus sp. FSL R7-0273 TaxID=1536772 RepID=UPI0004F69BC8|nr:thiamine diphosphokinase [Paenibacillus sp. FSL R7-0273]AIQ47594.1 thiamine pyrophosphokinase [Paenibacillus sp. FSL R7-0273]OMF95852.1 thiamine diphosphokinase [Paenibacillus sp. FSL R7-0273]